MPRDTDTDARTDPGTGRQTSDQPPVGAPPGDGTTDASRGTAGERTMAEVAHTHPETGRSIGGTTAFARGPVAVADGGRSDDTPEEDDEETLADVDHEPPNESEDANRVFERGEEGPVEAVDETDE